MSCIRRAAVLAAAAIVALAVPVPGRAAAPVTVALNRCNGQNIGEASARLHDYERHPPSGKTAALLKRYGQLVEVVAMLNEEREILDSICTSDSAKDAFFAQIAAAGALALALQADVAARLNQGCPAAATALPAAIVADAWLTLADIVNRQDGSVPAAFNDVIPKIQSRAQAVNLALPVWADTSAYWRDQVKAKAKQAVATCPSPSPEPSSP